MENTPSNSAPSENVGTKLLFENEKIRVWDLALKPGESLPTHVHKLPFCFIVARGGHLEHANPDRSEVREVNYANNLVVFRDPQTQDGGEVVHQKLTNIGEAEYQNFVIEFKE